MSPEIIVRYEPTTDEVVVWIRDKFSKMHLTKDGWQHNNDNPPGTMLPPYLTIGSDIAKQLWLQLGSELKLTTERKEEVTWLRDDLKHERGRVDKFIDYMIGDEDGH